MIEEIREAAGDWKIIVLSGELDFRTSPKIKESAAHVLKEDMLKLAVDVGRVSALDSSGLALLSHFRRRVTTAGGQFVLLRVRGPVQRIMETAQLGGIFKTADEESELDGGGS